MQLLGLQINLPWFMTAHAAFSLLAGVQMVVSRPPRSSPHQKSQALAGIATMAIGLSYFLTSYMPISENQFLHASKSSFPRFRRNIRQRVMVEGVPARVILGATMLFKVVLDGKNLTKDDRMKLWGFGVYDLFGGLYVGYWLGRFDGRAMM
jgi:hypothetical protein